MLTNLFRTALGWLGVNKLLVIAAVAGVALSGVVYLWKDAQLSDAKAALAIQQRDIAVQAATTNANTIEEVKRLSRLNGEAMAKFLADQRVRQDEMATRLQEINNAPAVAACDRDPVLDRTLDRVWQPEGNHGAGGEAGKGRDRSRPATPVPPPGAGRPPRPAPARRDGHRDPAWRLSRLRPAGRPDSPASRTAGEIAVSWQRHYVT